SVRGQLVATMCLGLATTPEAHGLTAAATQVRVSGVKGDQSLNRGTVCEGMTAGRVRGLWGNQIKPTFESKDNCITFLHSGSLQPGSKEFIFVQSGQTWSDALAYCRTHHVDLAVIEDASDLTTVSNLISTHWVWIGLSREPFRWSDNRISYFKNWHGQEPDNKQTIEHCVVEYSSPEHYWLDASCASTFPVICQQGKM
uniref:C-type lectin domain-containing protein n=1 Tax=Neogobius melanostomus TaxID=47308 RepID=A0A8C6UJZ4_9GOBI